MTLTDKNLKRLKVGELERAAINQRNRHVNCLVSFLSLVWFGLSTGIMIFRVIYAILVGTVAGEMSLSDFPCYKPKPPNYRMGLRIVGGIDAKQGEAPYMVGLMKHGGIVCGASIISENFLILAGHCVCNNQNNVVKPTQLKALIGMYKLSDLKTMPDNEIEGTTIKEVLVNKIIVHPDYDCGRKAENDVGEYGIDTQRSW